jgi:hypothetical protein
MSSRRGFLRQSASVASSTLTLGMGYSARLATASAATRVDVRGPVLGPLLARNLDKHPSRGGQNHVSMAILSMAALGGTPEQIQDLGEKKLSKAQPFPSGGPKVTRDNWRDHFGNIDALPGFRVFFGEEIAKRGVSQTLQQYVPVLFGGLGSAEFHCMIRTAYGFRFDVPAEIAMGLAYWSARFEPLVPPTPSVPGSPEYPLSTIANAVARNYVASGDDIIALHGVTGTHAYRVLEPFVGNRKTGLRQLWHALSGYLGLKSPSLAPIASAAQARSWADLSALAARKGGDHTVKLTDTAREEFHVYRDPIHLQVAALRLKLT